MRVGLEGDLRIAGPEDPRDRVEVDARGEEQGRRRVSRIVEAEAARQRPGPEEHSARRAAAPLAVGVLLRVRWAVALAAPAEVQVAVDDASAAERSAQALAKRISRGTGEGVRQRLPAGVHGGL